MFVCSYGTGTTCLILSVFVVCFHTLFGTIDAYKKMNISAQDCKTLENVLLKYTYVGS
jgi:hypothetical protein